MYKVLIFITFLFFTLSSCGNNDEVELIQCNTDDLVCTEDFRSITLKLVNSNDVPILLDSYETIRVRDGKKYQFEKLTLDALPYYTVFNDSERYEVDFSGEDFLFKGKKDGNTIVSEVYKIRHDCCHIQVLEGKTELVIDVTIN